MHSCAQGATKLPEVKVEGQKKGKERIQAFEGVVISKHLNSTKIDSTITVRKMFQNGGTEKVFLLNSPWIKSIEVLSNSVVRRSKLYYILLKVFLLFAKLIHKRFNVLLSHVNMKHKFYICFYS